MMPMPSKFLGIQEALKVLGGFARFYAADVPVQDVASMASQQGFRRVLCCCEGGDFALTFMGLGQPGCEIFAFDTCPAQLFLLAAKAKLIQVPRMRHFDPSLDFISRLYDGRIRSLPQTISKLGIHAKLVNLKTKKYVKLSNGMEEKFGVDILPGNDSGKTKVFWGRDQDFLSAIRKNIPFLRFIHEDVFLLPELFARNSLDVIFISDIHIPGIMPYYIQRLKSLMSCLKPGGVVIGDADCEGDLENMPTIIEILEHDAKFFGLKKYGKKGAVLALQKK
jgi:hypothetical protein